MAKKVDGKWIFTDDELDAQINHGKSLYADYVKDKPVALSYRFIPNGRILSIRAKDGIRIDFPVYKIKELRNASSAEIRKGYVTKAGDAIHWDNLNAHYTVAGLAANIFGTKEWMKAIARLGGSKKTSAKAKAARANGRKGGRPALLKPAQPLGEQVPITRITKAEYVIRRAAAGTLLIHVAAKMINQRMPGALHSRNGASVVTSLRLASGAKYAGY
ncbi:MAG: DUF2442 domain-containing protein [Pyrinomonadaceae bacterium]